MKTIHFFWVLGLVICNTGLYGQGIIAGQVSAGDLYKDVIPDCTMCASPYNPNGSNYHMNLDLDQDGVSDLAIHAWGQGILSGGSSMCAVDNLSAYTSVIAHFITSFGYTVGVADTISPGDSISPANAYLHTSSYIWSYNWGGAFGTGPEIPKWTGEHLIGVRLALPRETLFSWIRLSVADYCITVRDYACNKGVYTKVPPDPGSVSAVVFPNPANSVFTVNLNGEHRQAVALSVYSSTGMLFHKSTLPPGHATTILQVASWPAGLYLVKTVLGDQVSIRRLEIIH